MKRIIVLLTVFILTFSIPVFAEEKSPALAKADIQIISGNDHVHQIKEVIQLSNVESVDNHQLVHTFSIFDQTKMKDLRVTSNGQTLDNHLEKGKALEKLYVDIPKGVSGDYTYELSYSLSLPNDSYTTPLFVPVYSSLGNTNVVHITFQAPKGERVQKNSFPVVLKAGEESITSHIMNIPSQVRYVYSEKNSIFNGFNIVSWITLVILLSIIYIWIRSETNQKKEVAL